MNALFSSTLLVALAEMGDKTQLLALMLAARYRGQTIPIIAGILVATLLNHAAAAYAGHWLGQSLNQTMLLHISAAAFIALGLWALLPDRLDESPAPACAKSAFTATAISFFLAEMGDKTQIATLALGAQYTATMLVILGTTLGMLAANIPAILLGEKLLTRIPLRTLRYITSALFIAFGMVIYI